VAALEEPDEQTKEIEMRFLFEIEADVQRIEGKFATRDEIAEQIQGWLDNANEGLIDGVGADGASSYEVIDWSVNEIEGGKR
jgi:hypothetical protein